MNDSVAARVAALEALLVEKGVVDPAAVDRVIEHYESDVGPLNGAKVIARAWTDPAYRQRLLADGTRAVAEFGFGGPEAQMLVAVENTPTVHNVVVCTLCSCYPWPVLGLPPAWYKSSEYRSRMVAQPRTCWPRWASSCRRGAHPGLGQLGRRPLPRRARAPAGRRPARRGAAGALGHPRLDDRRWPRAESHR